MTPERIGTPERLGKYEIRGTLGQGAMGLVYDGWDPLIQRRVAIKTVSLAQGDDEDIAEGMARFRREAQAAGRLQHPNIVSVYDFGEAAALEYIVMEFMDGGTLKDVLDRDRILSVPRACDMMGHVLAALAYSHARGVIHRDVKPANIMLDSAGAVKLGDFGIARIEASSMTLVGDVLGTPAYMAPEQFLGDTADARSDIFAAAATLFHLVTGTRPYEGSRTAVRQKVLTATAPPSATDRAADVPHALDEALRRAMARQPADRFQTAAEFAAAIRAALVAPTQAPFTDDETVFLRAGGADATQAHQPGSAHPIPPHAVHARSPGRAVPLAAAAILLIAAAGGAVWYFGQARPQAVAPEQTLPAVRHPAPAVSPPVTAPAAPPQVRAPTAPPPSPRDVVAAAQRAAQAIECALTRAQAGEASVSLSGLAGAGGPQSALRQAVTAAARGVPLDWQVRTFDGPYCRPLAAIRTAWAGAPLALALQDQHGEAAAPSGTLLHDNDLMKPMAGGLAFAAYLRVDDVEADGSVVHVYPRAAERVGKIFSAGDPARLLPAFNTLVLGRSPRTTFGVGAPYGTDLILAVGSSEKLLAAARPNSEPAGPYLAALQAAIATAASHGAHLAAGAMTVETAR